MEGPKFPFQYLLRFAQLNNHLLQIHFGTWGSMSILR
jgi:hypothetical protein